MIIKFINRHGHKITLRKESQNTKKRVSHDSKVKYLEEYT